MDGDFEHINVRDCAGFVVTGPKVVKFYSGHCEHQLYAPYVQLSSNTTAMCMGLVLSHYIGLEWPQLPGCWANHESQWLEHTFRLIGNCGNLCNFEFFKTDHLQTTLLDKF